MIVPPPPPQAIHAAVMLIESTVEAAQCAGAATRIFEILQTRDAALRDKRLLQSLLDRSQENEKKNKSFDASQFDGTLAFRGVSFRYHEKENLVLKNVSFDVPAGAMVALVGASGGGKSTIVSLIEGFYQPTEGDILIGGKNVKEIDLPWMHANLVTIVSQEPSLFAGTSE